jgi:predicted N-acetyltransferase YhbS
VPVRSISGPEEINEVARLEARAFSDYAKGLSPFRDLMELDPSFRPEHAILAEEDGRIVSHVRIFQRPVRVGSATVTHGGIGGVATDPEYRKRGLASECMKAAFRYMHERGYGLSILFTGLHDFYRKLGWEIALPDYSCSLPSTRAAAYPTDSYSIRQFEPSLLRDVMRLYDLANRRTTASVVRSPRYWRAQLKYAAHVQPGDRWTYLREDVDRFWCIERGKRIVAYLRKRVGEKPALWEAFAEDLASMRAALALLARQYPDQDITCSAAPNSLFAQAAYQALGSFSVSGRGGMVAVVNLRALLRSIAPELENRLQGQRSRPKGKWRIKLEDESAVVEADGHSVALTRSSAGAEEIALPRRCLVQLVTGYREPEQTLSEWGLMTLRSRTIDLLCALFPRQWAQIWDMDHF